MNTRHEHDTHSHTASSLRAPSRGVLVLTPEEVPLSSEFFLLFAFRDGRASDGRGARPPLLAFFSRGSATVSSSLSDSVAITDGDPVPDSPGEDGGIGSHPLPPPGGRARSPWSTSRARTRGLSIVLGSPPPSAGSSPGSGGRGPPCRRSQWSGCHCDWPSPGEPVRPDSTLKGRVSSSLTSSDN